MTRYRFLDALRGFALLGILPVNVLDLADARPDVADRGALDLAVQGRFVPIFTLLFGVSLFLIADGARRRGAAAWAPLVWRMVGLGGIGLLHALVYPGEILRAYAIAGLLVTPLVVWVPARVNLTLGAVLTALSFGFGAGGMDSLPGLMLVGAGVAGVGVPARLERSAAPGLWLLGAGAFLAVPAVLAYLGAGGGDPRFSIEGTRAGLAMAIAYIGALAVLWQWRPARTVLRAALEPLGRASLTNYVSASLLATGLISVAGLRGSEAVAPLVAVAALIVVAQSVVSRAWLSGLRYGPLEWLLRMMTWRTVPRLRRVRPVDHASDARGSRVTT